jgi:hypothetical protein
MKDIPTAFENPTGDARDQTRLIRAVKQRNKSSWG